jgi:cob(I)alamin adenosyltransferase
MSGESAELDPTERMQRIDALLAHVWMVRTFLKHSEEAADDEELAEVHRELYDYMLALGPPLKANDAQAYLRMAAKKLARLKAATASLAALQPEVSGHTNFLMAVASLKTAVGEIAELLESHTSA